MAIFSTWRDREVSREIHRLFWRATKTNRPALILLFCTGPVGSIAVNVVIPLQVAYTLQAIINRDFDSVLPHASLIMVSAVVGCVLLWIAGRAIASVVRAGTDFVQAEVLANYLAKDYEFFTNTPIGALSSQATRLRHAYNEYCTVLNSVLTRQTIVMMVSIFIIAWYSPLLAITTVALLALVLSFIFCAISWRLRFRFLLSERHNETDAALGDVLSNSLTVKSFAAERYEKKRLGLLFQHLSKVQHDSWNAGMRPEIGRQFLAAAATFVLLMFTSQFYRDAAISTAMVVLVQLYAIKLLMATADIAYMMRSYDDFMSSAYKAAGTLLKKPKVLESSQVHSAIDRDRGDLALSNVIYRYDESAENDHAIDKVTLSVANGERVGLVGYSGSGKTTLTKLLLRFMDIDSGTITIGGVKIQDVSQHGLRSHIAYVPQEPLLFHRSIFDNIAYGNPDASKEAVYAAGKAAYVDEFVHQLPLGYETVVGEKGVKLSGGQRQRVAIARAILKDAPILVLDEATSALDSQSERYIQKALWDLMENRTALVIAHRLSTIVRMDRIVVLDNGRIAEIGTHEELLVQPESIYARLWGHQSTVIEDDLVDS